MIPGLSNALRGMGGEFEINRVVGAFGGVAYVVGANGFVVWNLAEGRAFNLTEYCLAFARGYNGKGQKGYDARMAQAWRMSR